MASRVVTMMREQGYISWDGAQDEPQDQWDWSLELTILLAEIGIWLPWIIGSLVVLVVTIMAKGI